MIVVVHEKLVGLTQDKFVKLSNSFLDTLYVKKTLVAVVGNSKSTVNHLYRKTLRKTKPPKDDYVKIDSFHN